MAAERWLIDGGARWLQVVAVEDVAAKRRRGVPAQVASCGPRTAACSGGRTGGAGAPPPVAMCPVWLPDGPTAFWWPNGKWF